MASEGISQFIDLGAGLPTSPSTRETAQAVIPDVRVAYVDNDPVAVTHLVALAQSCPGVTAVDSDVREANVVLARVGEGIDLRAPACLIMGSLPHFFPPDVARDLVRRYTAALAPGSYVVVSVGRSDGEASERFISLYRQSGSQLYYYTAAEIAALLESLEVVPPGITEARAWRPDGTCAPALSPRTGGLLAAVARVR